MNILIAALLLSAQESRPPETTVQGFKLPEGFSAKLFALVIAFTNELAQALMVKLCRTAAYQINSLVKPAKDCLLSD